MCPHSGEQGAQCIWPNSPQSPIIQIDRCRESVVPSGRLGCSGPDCHQSVHQQWAERRARHQTPGPGRGSAPGCVSHHAVKALADICDASRGTGWHRGGPGPSRLPPPSWKKTSTLPPPHFSANTKKNRVAIISLPQSMPCLRCDSQIRKASPYRETRQKLPCSLKGHVIVDQVMVSRATKLAQSRMRCGSVIATGEPGAALRLQLLRWAHAAPGAQRQRLARAPPAGGARTRWPWSCASCPRWCRFAAAGGEGSSPPPHMPCIRRTPRNCS